MKSKSWTGGKVAQRPIFGIFEGGGAKGVAHVGALAACEANGFYFVGVAGASAGAVVATLIAAGFSADELLDPSKPETNILARNGETSLSLLGEAEWKQAKVHVERLKAAAAASCVTRRFWSRWWLWRHRKPVFEALKRNGYLSTERARIVLNKVLWDQLTRLRAEKGITEPLPPQIKFRDLNYEEHPELRPLKIIASNVDSQELVIFGQERTPDLEIALAVAASIAIPGVFQPVMVPNERGDPKRHMDGGAVSNLPVWAFANDKLAFERANPQFGPVPTVGFTLKEETASKSGDDGLPDWLVYIGKGLATALSGSQSVIEEFVEDLRVIPLHVSLGTFAFGSDARALAKAHEDGRRCADRDLKHYLIDYPDLVRTELARFHKTIREALIRRRPKGHRRGGLLLRASIIQRFEGDVFRVTFGHRMDSDADDRLPLDRRGRASPRAFLEREAQFLRVWGRTPPSPDYMTKYERALANKAVRAIVAAPIFPDLAAWYEPIASNRPMPCGVVAIDSDKDLELEAAFNDPAFMSLIRAQSTLLYPALKMEPSRG